MCKTYYYKSRTCNHRWIQLAQPCGEGMDLVSCPDFSNEQPYGPAQWPLCPARWAPVGECPICDYETHDIRRRRMMVVRRAGVRVGCGPDRRDKPGVDFACGCSVM